VCACVCVTLLIQHEKRMSRIIQCDPLATEPGISLTF